MVFKHYPKNSAISFTLFLLAILVLTATNHSQTDYLQASKARNYKILNND